MISTDSPRWLNKLCHCYAQADHFQVSELQGVIIIRLFLPSPSKNPRRRQCIFRSSIWLAVRPAVLSVRFNTW